MLGEGCSVRRADSGEPSTAVRVDVLGPLRLTVDGRGVDVPGPKRRAVLALLAMAEGRAVTVDHLLDALWPSELPASGRAALHSHVSRLRGHLGPAATRLKAMDGAYRLVLGDDEVDAARARALLADARELAGKEPAAALVVLREARALWRGPVLADLAEVAPVAATSVVLEQLRRDVTDLLVECTIEAGQARDVLALAAEGVAAEPLREPVVLLLMRALAATGQAAAALRAGHEYRRGLASETGLDPSAALGELERRIVAGARQAIDRSLART
jgi:DNA-binding SARP family transcriptional activator